MNDDLEIKIAQAAGEMKDVFDIRKKVFVLEQNFTEKEEFDEYDDSSDHIIVLFQQKPIGCARVRKIGNDIKIERIALLKEFRGMGFGKKIIRFLIKYSQEKSPDNIYISAQSRLRNFYTKLGFEQVGENYDECGIDHIKMYLKQ